MWAWHNFSHSLFPPFFLFSPLSTFFIKLVFESIKIFLAKDVCNAQKYRNNPPARPSWWPWSYFWGKILRILLWIFHNFIVHCRVLVMTREFSWYHETPEFLCGLKDFMEYNIFRQTNALIHFQNCDFARCCLF